MIEQARQLLVNATRGEQLVDACVIYHSAIGTPLRITPWYPGFTDPATGWVFQYVPMRVEKPSTIETLSQQFKIIIQDLNEIAGVYLDMIPIDTEEAATFTAYSYLIDIDDVISLADGPYAVEIGEFSSEPQGIGFSAEPQATNVTKCGERGTIARTGGLYRQFT